MMRERIIQMISEAKNDPSLLQSLNGDSSILHDSGMESLQLIHFILRVEEEFGVEIDFDQFDMRHLESVDAFCAYVASAQPQPQAQLSENIQ